MYKKASPREDCFEPQKILKRKMRSTATVWVKTIRQTQCCTRASQEFLFGYSWVISLAILWCVEMCSIQSLGTGKKCSNCCGGDISLPSLGCCPVHIYPNKVTTGRPSTPSESDLWMGAPTKLQFLTIAAHNLPK